MRVASQGKLCTYVHKAQVSEAALSVPLFRSLSESLSVIAPSLAMTGGSLLSPSGHICSASPDKLLGFSFLSLRKQILARVGEHTAEDQSHSSEDAVGSSLPGFGGHRASNYWHPGPALRHSDHRLLGCRHAFSLVPAIKADPGDAYCKEIQDNQPLLYHLCLQLQYLQLRAGALLLTHPPEWSF